MSDDDHWGLLASALSSFDRSEEVDEDDISLDVREGPARSGLVEPSDLPPVPNTPVHQGKRYLHMKALVDALIEGRINKLAFANRIRPVAQVQAQMVAAMDEPEIAKRFSGLPEEEYELFKGVRRCLAAVGVQLQKMSVSHETTGLEDVKAAMQQISDIYVELHALQDRIVEIGNG